MSQHNEPLTVGGLIEVLKGFDPDLIVELPLSLSEGDHPDGWEFIIEGDVREAEGNEGKTVVRIDA